MEEKTRHNFDSFWQSLLTVFQVYLVKSLRFMASEESGKRGGREGREAESAIPRVQSRPRNYAPDLSRKYARPARSIFALRYFSFLFPALLKAPRGVCMCVYLRIPGAIPDTDRRGLERRHVRGDPGLRRRRQRRHPRLRLLHHPLHMRQLYPFVIAPTTPPMNNCRVRLEIAARYRPARI